jgi:calcineurin-like phosphoesterase family protein
VGNHDNLKMLAPFFKDMQLWIDMPGFIFTHTPLHESTLAEKHRFKEPKINVHGHIHTNPSPEGPYRCVCVEQINFTPINIEDLRA